MSYGPWWRRNRRAFHQFFNPRAVVELRSMHRAQVNHFLHRLLSAPDDFSEHIRQYVSPFPLQYISLKWAHELLRQHVCCNDHRRRVWY